MPDEIPTTMQCPDCDGKGVIPTPGPLGILNIECDLCEGVGTLLTAEVMAAGKWGRSIFQRVKDKTDGF